MYSAFFRPTTKFNKLLDSIFHKISVARMLTHKDLERWRQNSYTVYLELKFEKAVLDKIITDTEWRIDDTPPPNVWFGEAKFDGQAKPQVILYADSITVRLRPRRLFGFAGQAGMDHQFGHLYAYFSGDADYGEIVACTTQRKAAKKRGGIMWNIIAMLIPWIYKFHKEILVKEF